MELQIEKKEKKMDENLKIYSRDEVFKACLEYFEGDELAAQVWINKYALKDSMGNIYELTPNDMHRRIAKEFARIEANYDNGLGEEEIFDLIKRFKYIVPQGSPMAGIGNNFQYVSISNCFVIGNNNEGDSYGGILKLDQELVQLQKRRAGVGLDLSFIRPKGTAVKNSALTSTGVVPYMERFSNSTREVAQDGRRGALMESFSIVHPDAEDFIDAKMDPTKVTGANVSVRISDSFMESALSETSFTAKFPVDSNSPTFTKEVNATNLWKKIVHNAWQRAEPGILFWDTIIRESIPDCYADLGFKTISTNPCIVGNTLIAVADGRNAVTIKQLAEEGKDVPVYSVNSKTGQREIKWGRNPRLTKNKTEVWKLVLDDGSELIATPDHKILTKNLKYVELKDLKKGDSLNPFYSFESNGYRQISSVGAKMSGGAFRNRRQYRIVHEFISNNVVDSKKYAIHHKNFDSKDDRYENLEVLLHEDHNLIHREKMIGKNNPYYKMSNEWKLKFATHNGAENGRYLNVTNEELLKEGEKIFEKNGKLTYKLWLKHAKEHSLPQFIQNEFRFKTWNNFKNQVATNHKVESVEFYGYEDVYNITVDDNHNYDIITKFDDNKYIVSAGITVKNCGEITLCADDSCRLLCLNLYSYVENPFTENAYFNWDLFKKHAVIAQRLMDDLIDLEIEKVDRILEKIDSDPEDEFLKLTEKNLWTNIKHKCTQGRRTGLGVTAEGDMVAALGITYGTDKANDITEEVHKQLKLSAYRSSVNLAKERGSFPIYASIKEGNNPFINRIKEEDMELYADMMKYGRRNIALLTIAPTGSVSIMTQTTSGIEPAFLISYMRRRKINPNDKDVRVDFVDQVGDSWQNYPVFHHKFIDYLKAKGYDKAQIENLNETEIKNLIEGSPYHKATSNDVNWVKKVEMQGRIQKHVDHSISVTVNLPNEITEEIVGKVYETGWRSGCKGITVYRDGSRSGVLISEETKKEEEKKKIFEDNHAPKRPKFLDAQVHRFMNKGERWIAFVGLLDGRPYEIFTGLEDAFRIPKNVENGQIRRLKLEEASRYDFIINPKSDDVMVVEGLSNAFEVTYHNYAKMISGILRHGMPLEYVVEMVEKLNLDEERLDTWKNGIIRTIKKYIKDGTKARNSKCVNNDPDCALQYTEGCLSCPKCGLSKCG
jgi:ribonucleotide reductase alpha subunit